ncbi:glycosyltransferase family 1 protein [Oceanobacillus salinisoli]|uniref:glycosyltransferase family 1 protein n=1 Tax=Oceanobacillus salinisoli TaxID=2678611 RepID=UPI0012E31718|nr:glycosyltransferase family 1 protein [Oceanobacillus salinisoli]
MKKIKILQVIGSLRIGGAEVVTVNFQKYNQDQLKVDYLVYGDTVGELENKVKELGGRIIRIPAPKNGYLKFTRNVRNVIREYGPYDIVHSHPLFNSGFILKAAYIEKVPKRISHAHSARFNEKSSLIKKFYMGLMRYYIRNYSTHLLACSKAAGNYLFGEESFSEKGDIWNNAIDSKKYVYSEKVRNEVRSELNISGMFVIGHVGRLCDVKNQDFILDIFKEVKEKNTNSKLLLVGDGAIKNNLERKVKNYNLKNDVLFLGARNDVNRLLQGMDVFLFPSKYEGLGIALIEAQAAGLQCIISDAIPQEVEITNLINRVPLSKNATEWAEKVLNYNNGYGRMNTLKEISLSGYDIEGVIQKVKTIYVPTNN